MSAIAFSPRRSVSTKGEATRARVLDAALQCLQANGYSGTSVVQIQNLSGVSRGAIQNYWPSKAALVVAAVDRLLDEVIAQLEAQVLARSSTGDRIDVGVEESWAVFQHPLVALLRDLVAVSRTDPELRAIMLAREVLIRSMVRELFVEIFGAELAAHPRFPIMAEVLLHSMQGAALEKSLDTRETPRPELVAAWKTMLREAIGPTKVSPRSL